MYIYYSVFSDRYIFKRFNYNNLFPFLRPLHLCLYTELTVLQGFFFQNTELCSKIGEGNDSKITTKYRSLCIVCNIYWCFMLPLSCKLFYHCHRGLQEVFTLGELSLQDDGRVKTSIFLSFTTLLLIGSKLCVRPIYELKKALQRGSSFWHTSWQACTYAEVFKTVAATSN